MTKHNICTGVDDVLNKFENFPDGSTLVIDEGSLFFSSRDHMNKEQRKLIKILNVIRQKKMILIIICPTFFDLNKYISVHRSRFLIHVSTDKKLSRGRFMYFGTRKKNLLFELGKRSNNSYKRPRSNFTGTFTNFQLPFHQEYLDEIKTKTMEETFKEKEKEDKSKQILEELKIENIHRNTLLRNLLIVKIIREGWLNQTELANYINRNKGNLSRTGISGIMREYGGGVVM